VVALGLRTRLDLEQVGPDAFRGRAANFPERVYGGEVAAQAVAATHRTVEASRSAFAVQCTYLLPGDPGDPIDYAVERTRDGRSYSTRRVVASQSGAEIFVATVSLTIPRPDGQGFNHGAPMPTVPPPADLPTIATSGDAEGKAWGEWATLHPEFEMRPVTPECLSDPYGRRQFWCRFSFDEVDDPQRQSVLAVYGSDFTMLSSIRVPHEPDPARRSFVMTTLNHSVHIHRPFRASSWHLVDHYSPAAAGGRGIAISHLYTSDGVLAASAIQEGMGFRTNGVSG
jgi:acyl-CoA thioesterase-2